MKKIHTCSLIKYFFAITIALAVFSPMSADAKTYKLVGYSLSEISTTKPIEEFITIQVPSQKIVGAGILFENDAMLRARVTNVQPAKRGKRAGYIDTVLVAYSVPSLGNQVVNVSDRNLQMRIKRYSEKDFKGLAETAATTVVGHVFEIPFLAQGVAAVKGAVNPIEGESRIKSAGIGVYESTPLKFISKGQELEAEQGTRLTLSFKVEAEENNDN